VGQPSGFTQEVANLICERMAKGESLRSVCRDEGMPAESSVREWALDDQQGFAAQYARARELQAEALVGEIIEISDDGTNDFMVRKSNSEKGAGIQDGKVLDQEHMQRSRLRVDSRKWLASKILPKIYGDKLQHSGDENSPIKHEHDVAIRPQLTREEWLKTHGKD